MKILADFHHSDLFESHQLVFGDRFGAEVYAPYGRDWFDRWYWSHERSYHGDAIALQYLEGIFAGGAPDANGVVRVPDARHPGRTLIGITLDAALATDWDVVLSSVPDNAAGFRRLAQETGGRFGIHIGNQWGQEAWDQSPTFAIVTTTNQVPAGIPHAVVHQEFRVPEYRAPAGFGPIRSFVNCFPENVQTCKHGGQVFPGGEYGRFTEVARGLPEFAWQVYGAYGTAPLDEFAAEALGGSGPVMDAMAGAGAIWHAKHWSDGFGHVIHNAFAVGRPVFGYAVFYRDKLAGPLWQEGITSFDVDRLSNDDLAAELRRLRDDPDHHRAMCEAAAARFREVVDFEEDADKIAGLLGAAVAA